VKVRAIATTAERSNAIGTVELECTPFGLSVVYLGVGTFAEGYAPGALTTNTRVTVPWPKVREARLEGEELYLDLDPSVTPHSRLTLVNFSTGQDTHHREIYKQRMVLRIGIVAGAILSVLFSALGVPRIAPRAGAAAALTLGGAAALLILVIGLAADRQIALGGRASDAARETFAFELSRYLPNLARAPHAPMPAPKVPGLPTFEALLPRTTLAIVITLSAGILGVVLTAHWIVTGGREAPPPARVAENDTSTAPAELPAPNAARPAAAALAPPAPPKSASPMPPKSAPAGDVAEATGPCHCERADSTLWRAPLPKLMTLTLSQHLREDVHRHKHLALDIAAVNDTNQDMNNVALMVQFFDRDPPPSNKRYPISNRALFYAGPLGPGQAVMWSTEARGSEFEIANNMPGTIDPSGGDAAPTNLIADLLRAHHRPVRLYGAMLLSYFGDPRARPAVLKLRDALRDDEAPYLRRLLYALGDVRGCELQVSQSGATRTVQACLYNATNQAKKDLAFSVRALDRNVNPYDPLGAPPTVVAESTWKLPGVLGPKTGVLALCRMNVSNATAPPVEFEIVGDRDDLSR
jgi:hypothetical protein